jgi:hypothetical protein
MINHLYATSRWRFLLLLVVVTTDGFDFYCFKSIYRCGKLNGGRLRNIGKMDLMCNIDSWLWRSRLHTFVPYLMMTKRGRRILLKIAVWRSLMICMVWGEDDIFHILGFVISTRGRLLGIILWVDIDKYERWRTYGDKGRNLQRKKKITAYLLLF